MKLTHDNISGFLMCARVLIISVWLAVVCISSGSNSQPNARVGSAINAATLSIFFFLCDGSKSQLLIGHYTTAWPFTQR